MAENDAATSNGKVGNQTEEHAQESEESYDADLDMIELHPDFIYSDLEQRLAYHCIRCEVDEVQTILGSVDFHVAKRLLSEKSPKPEDIKLGDVFMRHGPVLFCAIFDALVTGSQNKPLIDFLVSLPAIDLEQEWDSEIYIPRLGRGTVLLMSCAFGQPEIVELLLQHGADPNHTIQGCSPIVMASTLRNGSQCVKLLLEHNAVAINDGMSLALYVACMSANLANVEVMLEEFNIEGPEMVTPEQLVLCLTLLVIGLALEGDGQSERHTIDGMWAKACEDFRQAMGTNIFSMSTHELSQALYQLYLQESLRVQTGKPIELKHDKLLHRTLSRFPNFSLCLDPDILTDMGTLYVHHKILESCVLNGSPLDLTNASFRLTKLNLLRNQLITNKEQQRLCLLLVLETYLSLQFYTQLLDADFLENILECIINNKLHQNNQSYLMLVFDILIEAIEKYSERIIEEVQGSNDRKQVESIYVSHMTSVACISGRLLLLIVSEGFDSIQEKYLIGLLCRMFVKIKQIEDHFTDIFMENQILKMVITHKFPAREDDKCIQLLGLCLSCGGNANARNDTGSTVLCDALTMPEPYRSNIMQILLYHGGHMDVTDSTGYSPYNVFRCFPNDFAFDVLQAMSLKCAAARTIDFFKIPYRHCLPPSLQDFVALHGKYVRK